MGYAVQINSRKKMIDAGPGQGKQIWEDRLALQKWSSLYCRVVLGLTGGRSEKLKAHCQKLSPVRDVLKQK